MQWVVVSQWVRVRQAPVPPDESRANRSGATPRASPHGAVRSRVERGGRPREGAPQWVASWEADGCQWLAGRSPGCAMARAQDPTGVSERGMSAQGERGNLGEPPVSLSYPRSGGPGDHRPWRDRELPPGYEPARETTNAGKHARDREASDTRSAPRRAWWQSERRRVPRKVGNRGPRDPPEGRRRRAECPTGGNQGRDAALTNPDTRTPVDCGG
jgi:hypothetical protein